jgi:hypothetical protein
MMLFAQAKAFAAVTPDDDTDLPIRATGLYVGGEGNVSVVSWDNEVVTFTGLAAGAVLPIPVRRVRSTGTTATGIIALQQHGY